MSLHAVSLQPIDAWFFRDGRPYDQEESTQAWVESQFPPPAPTVIGALRLALARAQGFSGLGSWNPALAAVLGDGPDDLGALRFVGPRLRRRDEELFPLPRHVLGELARVGAQEDDRPTSWVARDLLAPAAMPGACDLDGSAEHPVWLPQPTGMSGLERVPGHRADQWVTATGLARVLAGRLPEASQIAGADALWRLEPRVGLERAWPTRTARQGALYSPSYVRLGRHVSLAVGISGVPDGWSLPSTLTLGGEGRMAYCDGLDRPLSLPACPAEAFRQASAGRRRLAVILLTPACLMSPQDEPAWPRPGEPLPGLSGTRVVSACMDRPLLIGGWDGRRRQPLPLRPFAPAGSVWFCELDDDADLDEVLARHGDHIGRDTAYGFGQIALGVWPGRQGEPS
jgi:CRISPR-associated protein Cmr3